MSHPQAVVVDANLLVQVIANTSLSLSSQRLLEGSDHALSDFDDHLPHILNFLLLCD